MRRDASAFRIARTVALLSVGGALISLGASGAFGREEPAGPRPLAGYFPRQDLVVLVEFDGLDAHAVAWKETAAYRLLNETSTGAMLEQVAIQLADRAFLAAPGGTMTGVQWLDLVLHGFRSGFAFGINHPGPPAKPTCIGFILRGGADVKVRGSLERILRTRARVVTLEKPGGRTLNVVGEVNAPSLAWWAEGDDLALSLVAAGGADAMIETLDGKRPSAVDHPVRVELTREEGGFVPVGRAFFDTKVLPALPPQAVQLGLDKVKRLDYRWGFQGDALMTITRVLAPSPRTGFLALLDQPTFGMKDIPPLPPGLAGYTVASVDPARLYGQLVEQTRAFEPDGQAFFDAAEQVVRQKTGRRLREDILAHLGPRVVSYVVPTRINAPTNPIVGFARGMFHVPRASLAIQVDDPEAFAKVLDDLVKWANRAFRENPQTSGAEFNRLEGDRRGYVLSIPPSVLFLPAGASPTILVGAKSVVIGSTPDVARQAVELEARGGQAPDDRLARATERLPANMTFLTVGDTRESLLPDVLANLPGLVQVVGSGSWANMVMPLRRRFAGPGRVSGPRGFRLEIEPDLIPAADDLRPFLFASSFAWTVDDQGFQFLSRESFPSLNPTTVIPVAIAMMLPAVQSSRLAAMRAQSTNNLKQIALAMHNFHSTNDHFPPQAIADKQGKPLLSWRVAILPFLEQAALFNEFKLDEPWDSPHNKPLLQRMPAIYAIPGSKAEPGMSFYRGFSGPGAFFDPAMKDGTGIRDVTDGTSNTIGIVEAREAVPWTKPDAEIPFDGAARPEGARQFIPSLGGHFPSGFNAMLLDGSVRFIKDTINTMVLRALITRNGGEVISSDAF